MIVVRLINMFINYIPHHIVDLATKVLRRLIAILAPLIIAILIGIVPSCILICFSMDKTNLYTVPVNFLEKLVPKLKKEG